MLFKSKHQKLILQCYPPGKGVDKKPNSSELSYLLYYASARRIKLEKVIAFLNRKTVHDSNRTKTGNLQVTLNIVSSLIERCSDNLNVFAFDVCAILLMTLKIQDLALIKAVLETYGILCKNLDSGLFVGDRTFIELFGTLTSKLIDTGIANSQANRADRLEWKLVSLIACRHTSNCLGYSGPFSRKFLSKRMPLLVETFAETDTSNSLITKLSNSEGVEGHRLSKVITGRSVNAQKHQEDFENDNVDTDDIRDETLNGLKSIFGTNSTNQIIDATNVVVIHNFETKKDAEWSNRFLELCTSWIPVQLRFVVLSTLVAKLNSLSEDANTNFELLKRYALNTSGLISSKVNMIGLSTSDVIQQILSLKQALYFDKSLGVSQEDIDELSTIFSNCIVDLSTHIYYFDQVPDSIYEIFVKIDSVLELAKVDGGLLLAYTKTLLSDILRILEKITVESSNIARNHVGLDTWEVSLPLLSQKHASSLYSSLTVEQVREVQLAYINIFESFLNNELVQVEDKDDEKTSSKSQGGKFLAPDASDLISKQNNFIAHFLIYVDKYIYNNDEIDLEVAASLLQLTKLIVGIFGVNFVHNYIPFALHWQINKSFEDTTNFTLDQKVRDTFAYTLLRDSLEVLGQYPELTSYISKSALSSKLPNLIGLRQVKKSWVEELSTHVPALTTNISNEADASLAINDMQEFVAGDKYLTKWLNAAKPLSLSILKKDLIGGASDEGTPVNFNNILTAPDSSSASINTEKHGYGLGTNGDISSIHSGIIRNGNGASNGHTYSNGSVANGVSHTLSGLDLTNGSIYTNNKAPRVSDLKDVLNEKMKKPAATFDDQRHSTTPGSVLSKHMTTHDVDSILKGLDTDDDSIIV